MVQNVSEDKTISQEKFAIAELRRVIMSSKARAMIHNVTPLLVHTDKILTLEDFQDELIKKYNEGILDSYRKGKSYIIGE